MSTITTRRSLRPFLCHLNDPRSILSQRYNLSLAFKPINRSFSASAIRKEINGPPSTLPPPLELPGREPEEAWLKFALRRGKSYLSFYKTGGKAVFSNFMASQPIQKEIDKKYGLHKESFSKAIDDGAVDRAQFQLLMRSWHDIWKMPLFGLMFIVIGEWTPVVVLFIPNVVPLTCRIPKQIEKSRTQLEEARRKSFRWLTEDLPDVTVKYPDLNRTQLLHINASLGLSSSLWEYVGGVPGILLNRRVRKKMEYLDHDDMLIEKEGGAAAIADKRMELEEVKLALVDRGIDVIGRNEKSLRNVLEAWFQARKYSSIERLLLSRPNVWPDLRQKKAIESGHETSKTSETSQISQREREKLKNL